MGSFVTVDTRGFTVVLPESTWTHAQPHLDILSGRWGTVTDTIQAPGLILDNPLRVLRPGETQRVAHERYVKFWEDLGLHVVVPMRILDAPQRLPGYGTLDAGTRVAVTIWASTDVPTGTIIWNST